MRIGTSPSRQPQVLQDAHGGIRFVERIEVNAGSARAEQVFALAGGILDAEFGGRSVVVAQLFELRSQGNRNARAAQGGEAFDLGGAQDGNDSGDKRHFHTVMASHVVAETVEIGVVKEQMGDDEVGACVNFFLQMDPIGV